MAKVLTDNRVIKEKLGTDYHDDVARGLDGVVKSSQGFQRMMHDFALTASEVASGLCGMSVQEWMESRALAAGMSMPTYNPTYQRELSEVLADNARVHKVSPADYARLAPTTIRERMGRYWGSKADPDVYASGGDPMDWSGRLMAPQKSQVKEVRTSKPAMFAHKQLKSNSIRDNMFADDISLDDDAIFVDWEEQTKGVGRSLSELEGNIPEPDISRIRPPRMED